MQELLILTSQFPFGRDSENFLTAEVNYLSQFYQLKIFPVKSSKIKRKINTSVSLVEFHGRIKIFLWIVALILLLFDRLFWSDLFSGAFRNSINKSYRMRSALSSFFVYAALRKIKPKGIIYAYWNTHLAMGAQIYKKRKRPDLKILVRCHSYDIDEESVGFSFPFRQNLWSQANTYAPVSSHGIKTLALRGYDTKCDLRLARLGVQRISPDLSDLGNKPSFVSCSGIRDEKRVKEIGYFLAQYAENNSCPLEWTHIGGPDDKKQELENYLGNPSLLEIKLKGHMELDEIKDLYSKEKFNIFINFSVREGVPVAIMEAISATIPVIATNVGGTSEIVNSLTGIIINPQLNFSEFSKAVDRIIKNYCSYENTLNKVFNEYIDEDLSLKRIKQILDELQ